MNRSDTIKSTTSLDSPTVDRLAAFLDQELIAHGDRDKVLARVKRSLDERTASRVLFFRDRDGSQIDFDLRGTIDDVLVRAVSSGRCGPGRPKLGVVGREVSLLPRHWEWLEAQPNGISAALRRLVDHEIKKHPDRAAAHAARDATGRFLTAMAGNLKDYEESTRALYRGELERFRKLVASWPADIRKHARRLARTWFESVRENLPRSS